MNLPRSCVKNPVTTMVFVILAVLFGLISLYRIPVQMKPTIDRPVITVDTGYKGAAPLEVEEEVTKGIEKRLTSVEGLSRMTSTSQEGRSRVILEFDWGTNKNVARLDVSEKLGLVRNLPDDSDKPIVKAVNSDSQRPIAWIMLKTDLPLNNVLMVADDEIRPKFERIDGVGSVRLYGGSRREVRVTMDYEAMSARGITVRSLRDALIKENQNTKGGKIDEGKRRYAVRTIGNFTNISQLKSVIVARTLSGPVYLRDIADVNFDYAEPSRKIRQNGKPALGFGILRKTGANTVAVMKRVRKAIKEVNIRYSGRDIRLKQVYDETKYIDQSRNLVINNIYIGGTLAVTILLIFLASISGILVVGIAIPVAVIATFIFIFILDRSMNIISLAGLAFAVGMVVDNSIVVLENIFRHKEMGKSSWNASIDGATEVWGAVLASTLTTLAVFIPIIFLQDESGQLFKDIAIAISAAVGISLVVSVTVVPMLTSRFLKSSQLDNFLLKIFTFLQLYAIGRFIQRAYISILRWFMRGVLKRICVVLLITIGAVLIAWKYFPPIDYLPKGNRNLFFVFLRMPPGLNLNKVDGIINKLEKKFNKLEELDRFFAVIRVQRPIIGLVAKEKFSDLKSMRKLNKKLFRMVQGIPGVRAFVTQASLFRRRGSGFIGGINLHVDITGNSLQEIQRISGDVGESAKKLKGVRFVNSSFDLGSPELQVHVDREKAANLGISVSELGDLVETLVNGTRAGLFFDDGEELNIILRDQTTNFLKTQQLSKIKINEKSGNIVELRDIAEIRPALGPTKIEHIDRDRSLSITVNIGEDLPLQIAIDRMKEKVISPIRKKLPLGYSVNVAGRAKDLERTWDSLKWSFLLALFITYLLMAALFEAWSYPFIIMFSVPFATTGGILLVSFVNSIESSVKMDTLTMLGFIILTGIVVNNAILLVHQSLNHFRSGMKMKDAILESCKDRMRPIFMTTATTVFGMLPLVTSTGSGSELYRGLGSAVLGGLATSALFTLILIPVIFSLWVDLVSKVTRKKI